MIIAFAWTTPAMLAGAKTVTRRNWKAEHAIKFQRGDVVDAWNRSPRAGRSGGARRVALIQIDSVTRGMTGGMSDADFVEEGLQWLADNGHQPPGGGRWAAWWHAWREANELVWVVRFHLIGIADERTNRIAFIEGALR